MKFIATADWQLGMTASFLDNDARPRFHEARFAAIRKIGAVAKKHDVAFVVVCGDVFESNKLDRKVLLRTFEALRSIEVPVYLLPGNHDPLDASSIYDAPAFASSKPANVHVIRDSKPILPIPGVEIVGIPWLTKFPTADLLNRAVSELNPVPAGTIRIIAGHGGASTLSANESADIIDIPSLEKSVDQGLAHFVALGDRHSTTRITDEIWFAGTPVVTSRVEDDPGNVLVVEINRDDKPQGLSVEVKVEVKVEIEKVDQWQFKNVTETLNSVEDVRAFQQRLASWENKSTTGLWLALEGSISTSTKAHLDNVLEENRAVFAHLEYWDRNTDLAVIAEDEDFDGLQLSGFARDALEDLKAITESGSPEEKTAATEALGLLYRFAGGTR